MKFTRLRLSGFKSFVEPTELFVEPGLTAVIGPNGCGKSNLFDAMRWVMGETRPSSVRGSEMDDVIFAGSAGRPARNVAEVTLFIDNTDRTAGSAFNEFDTIEVSRRIEREAGSVYRINGRDVRQRDVQIFFADASSGAGSTAFVRQGQIGLLISQKPLARRAILEEAAGIGGLHQRRHEAELRLRAAETNLSRLEDVIREVEGQVASLKRQARQASRYRNLSGHIRKAEALAHYLRWTAAEARSAIAAEELSSAAATVAGATETAAKASTVQSDAAATLPPLRHTEAERGAAHHRLIAQREQLDAEEARAREAAQRIRQLIAQGQADAEREQLLEHDADSALSDLDRETRTLNSAADSAGEDLATAQQLADEMSATLAETENLLERLTAELAEWNARKSSLERGQTLATALLDSSVNQLSDAQARLDAALESAKDAPDVHAAESETERARGTSEGARAAAAEARARFQDAEAGEAAARTPLEAAEHEVQRLSAEVKALGELLHPEGEGLFPPLVDAVTVQSGYEAALAAALGDDLQAPLDSSSPHHWRDLGPFNIKDGDFDPALPAGAKALGDFVKAPAALARRLAMTGLVFPDQGAALQSQLKPGQRLVSARGDLWRWDGFIASADAPSASAIRLSQRNRLTTLEVEAEEARTLRAARFSEYSFAKDAREAAREALRQAEAQERGAEQALIGSQDQANRAARAAAERASQLASLESEIRRLTQSVEAAEESQRQAVSGLEELGDGVALSQNVADVRGRTADTRTKASEARGALEGLRREGEARQRRLATIADEQTRWNARKADANTHVAELVRRQEELTGELGTAEQVPQAIAEKRNALLDAIATAETARNEASDARQQAETLLTEADRHAKAADAALSSAREERARAQALSEAASQRIEELKTRIHDELECAPSELAMRAEIKDGEELPPLDQAEKRVERLKNEREQLGGVNLRAEEEAVEQETRLTTLVADRDDLTGAIDRLRRGIQSLNKEGRERLLASFEKVNANFQELFTKLFEGGEAKLTFTESEDPLEAGLEIFARPPGKRLQSLALLSGGEQALTAMALIFAVFLVNPAPVCVLDEVDAPLDDANVERFCNMLNRMAEMSGTRFLVITHHALTMSRMDRLFGVTMAERGVSQLVSVSLDEAEKIAAE
ncbi:MAG: chromosome segregation protein SMC [Alphaproteobacteria bacterium]|nr:chromosome segregation protein SMC [Alphaproteobacteria bacterium]